MDPGSLTFNYILKETVKLVKLVKNYYLISLYYIIFCHLALVGHDCMPHKLINNSYEYNYHYQ